MTTEIWKPVVGYEGLYEVSNLGNVKSVDKVVQTKRGSRHYPERRLSEWVDHKNYKTVLLCKNGKQRTTKVHRIVAEAFIENPLGYKQINHIDCDKRNNNVSNLEWCNNSRNQKHAYEHGLNTPRQGELNGGHKLVEKQVIEIRRLYDKGVDVSELSKRYCVTKTQIRRIVNYKSWKYLR